jgi:hypothetical protein
VTREGDVEARLGWLWTTYMEPMAVVLAGTEEEAKAKVIAQRQKDARELEMDDSEEEANRLFEKGDQLWPLDKLEVIK